MGRLSQWRPTSALQQQVCYEHSLVERFITHVGSQLGVTWAWTVAANANTAKVRVLILTVTARRDVARSTQAGRRGWGEQLKATRRWRWHGSCVEKVRVTCVFFRFNSLAGPNLLCHGRSAAVH